jgi:ATP-dependent DNA helicase RecQ
VGVGHHHARAVERDELGERLVRGAGVGDPLFDALRACRRELAQEQGVPPYVILY